ncbi:MAG: cation transporter [Deltaproteobacteria bacterium]|uniref:Cation transporter n=1 Tax=Candidatus Zymogenus saltonus TaxID=2844893 RepID=A0A9D8PNY5_9DELT|nr:cation transporter [Candidatus Zymogenus saltonus]
MGKIDLEHTKKIKKVTIWGLVVNVLLSVLKFVFGTIGGSQAVVADAVHSLSDIVTDVTILVGVRYWSKPADLTHPHGHRRLEVIVTMGIGVVLGIVATGILYNALVTLYRHHESSPGWIAFWAAFVSIFSKEIVYQWTVRVGNRIKSAPLVANAWHHRSDALSSIPAALAVAGAAINPRWAFLDHLGAVVVSIFIYYAAFKIVRPAFDTLVDRGAPEEDVEKIRMLALNTKGVKAVHEIRSRYISGISLAVDLHIEVDKGITVKEGHDIAKEVKRTLLKEGPEVADVVVHLEPYEK